MRVVHTISSLRSDHGGPSRSVTALCNALARTGTEAAIVTHARGAGEGKPVMPDERVKVDFVERVPGWRVAMGMSPFGRAVAQQALPGTVVHDHGLWLPTNHAVAHAARATKTPRIVSIRGMLSEWALDAGQAKKRVAWWVYQRRDLATASVLHATSEAEVEHVRRVGLRQSVAFIQNGVAVPKSTASHERTSGNGRRTALFLSRLHPVKGLMNLVEAWAQVRPDGWDLVLAGPDADGYRAEVEQRIDVLGLDGVACVGEVSDAEKWERYAAADLFVLPTFSENFGIVVAEALAAGVPVITTTGAPWRELETHQCGWWVEIGIEPLAEALAEATSLPDDARRAMGARGRTLIEQEYAWSRVADEMDAVYGWLLGQAPRPDCIVD